jgi:hypothetical protein
MDTLTIPVLLVTIATNSRKASVFHRAVRVLYRGDNSQSSAGPTRSRFSVVFLGPRANAELVPKFHVALYASHAALPMVI